MQEADLSRLLDELRGVKGIGPFPGGENLEMLKDSMRKFNDGLAYKSFLDSITRLGKPNFNPIEPPNYSYELTSI